MNRRGKMEIFIEELKEKVLLRQPGVLKIEYSQFKKLYDQVEDMLGEECLVMVSEKMAVICFDKYSDIKIHVYNDKYFTKENFSFIKKAAIIGGRAGERISFLRLLVDDIKRLFIPIIFAYIVLSFFYMSSESGIQKLSEFNELLINVCSIFIATVFVFIGLFYGDKERTVILYRKGRCDIEYYTDRYVISLSFISLCMLIVSFCICNIGEISFGNECLNNILSKFKSISEYDAALAMTYIAVGLIIICFDSLISYYLKTCRNEFFVEAFNSEMEDRKKNRNSK